MRSFSKFIISYFEWDPDRLLATFHFAFDDQEHFREVINFSPLIDQDFFPLVKNEKNQIFHLLSHLHIALGVSYYKLFPTQDIVVQSSFLDEQQKKFRNTFYIKGLGEFFFQNQLDPRGLAIFSNSNEAPKYQEKISLASEKALVLFWGGKDSLVTVELLKKQGKIFDLLSFGKDYPLHQIAQFPTQQKRLIIERKLDLLQLQKLSSEGYYNGHLPITWIILFVSLVLAYLYGYGAVITSLEKSADEGNTEFFGLDINHQRSKSSEFEQLFQKYVQSSIASDFSSFSLLRERYEIRIVKEFCNYPQYFHHFSSCNRNFHQKGSKLTGDQLRCWICPKCAFVYTMMRAFLEKELVNQIFSHDLFDDKSLLPLFSELLGISGIKPFECVGTNEEMILALRLIREKEWWAESPIMHLFESQVLTHLSKESFLDLEKKLLG